MAVYPLSIRGTLGEQGHIKQNVQEQCPAYYKGQQWWLCIEKWQITEDGSFLVNEKLQKKKSGCKGVLG